MIEACANPECGKILRYLREGRILLFTGELSCGCGAGVHRRVEHYWLCGSCCRLFTLRREGDHVCLVFRPSVFFTDHSEREAA